MMSLARLLRRWRGRHEKAPYPLIYRREAELVEPRSETANDLADRPIRPTSENPAPDAKLDD